MKELVKRLHKDEEGFTLAELLIVVAIIAVLVAIAIPVFGAQLAKAEVATDTANFRSLYADLQAKWLTDRDGMADGVGVGEGGSGVVFTDGQVAMLKRGTVSTTVSDNGVQVTYTATNSDDVKDMANAKDGKIVWGGAAAAAGGGE